MCPQFEEHVGGGVDTTQPSDGEGTSYSLFNSNCEINGDLPY